MKAAVLSDIHGNHIALETCMEEIHRRDINKLIFLGDYVGELAYPQKTMALIKELKRNYECYFVWGNKEDYWIDYKKGSKMTWKDNNSTTGMLLYPVIAGMATQLGIDPTPLYFGLLSGATLGGNITPIGASANITGIGILRKEGYEVKNADFFKIGIPFTLAAVIPAYIYFWVLYGV